MPRTRVDWKIKNQVVHLGERTILVGVVNITPESVADAGRYMDPDRAFERALQLIDQGADIIELGGESLRPGAPRVTEAEELRRVIPVVKRLRGKIGKPIIVETYKSAVAEKALEHGASIIKDSTGLTIDPELAKVAAKFDASFIVQHMRGMPDAWAKLGNVRDPVGTVIAEMNAAINRVIRAGVQRERIAIDPGFGLGKRKEQNSELLIGLDNFNQLKLPIQVSPTGKQFNTATLLEPSLSMSIAAATMAVLRGAHLLRVHDIDAIRPAALVADQAIRDL
jgi:dihydropteroate synthase